MYNSKNNPKHKNKKSSTPFFHCEGHQYWKKSSREAVKSLSLEILKTQRDKALSGGAGQDDLQRCHLSD